MCPQSVWHGHILKPTSFVTRLLRVAVAMPAPPRSTALTSFPVCPQQVSLLTLPLPPSLFICSSCPVSHSFRLCYSTDCTSVRACFHFLLTPEKERKTEGENPQVTKHTESKGPLCRLLGEHEGWAQCPPGLPRRSTRPRWGA